jgi:hypothetical protein
MDLKTIVNKIVDGTKILLVQPTMIFRVLGDESLDVLHHVDEDEVGRPDLIADKYFGDHRMVDIILKYNRISDPFSIGPGEILRIPKKEIAYYKLERPNFAEESNAVKDQFIKTKRLPPKDQAKIERLKKKYGKEELLPPNVVPSGQKTYEFDGEGIRLGKQAQTAPVTSSTTLEKFNGSDKDLVAQLDDAVAGNAGGNEAGGNLYDEGYAAGVAWRSGTGKFGNSNNSPAGEKADETGGNDTASGNPQNTGNGAGGTDADADSPCAK